MEEKKSVAEVTQHLREIEDYNLAFRLQEEEFMSHYNRNREGRRLVSNDTRQSILDQANEDEAARRKRLEELRKITETDEEIALRLQKQFEEEERQRLAQLARQDAELAQRLAQFDELIPSSSTTRSDRLQFIPEVLPTAAPLIDLSHEVSTSAVLTQSTVPQPRPIPNVAESSVESALSVTPAATPIVSSQNPSINLHPTNPFLQDLSSQQPSTVTEYHSEFGLPPPSDLALGKHR